MSSNRILVVEDEAFIAHDIKRILDASGYDTVIDCFTVDMAIQMIRENRPDLVLVDINLGERKTGLDLAEYLDKVVRIPYIFITSYSDLATLKKVATHAQAGFVTKPFKTQDLTSAVFLALSRISDQNSGEVIVEKPKVKGIPFAITRVLDHINENIGEHLDLHSLAALTEWESEHFGRIFKEHIGLTPYQYVLKAKIDRAKELLTRSEESLQVISFQLGFSTYSNFFNAFKKQVKMSPEHYRKLIS